MDTRAIVFLIVLNLAFSFAFRSSIAWQAHVGGLIVGSLITAAYAYAPRNHRALVQGGATIVILAVLVIAVLMRECRARPPGPGLTRSWLAGEAWPQRLPPSANARGFRGSPPGRAELSATWWTGSRRR